jgi:hypothetical protein
MGHSECHLPHGQTPITSHDRCHGSSTHLGQRLFLLRASGKTQAAVWATAYNLVAIPVAAGLFIHWGVDLPMSVGAIAMSLSTIIVAGNAQLLRRLNLKRESGKDRALLGRAAPIPA